MPLWEPQYLLSEDLEDRSHLIFNQYGTGWREDPAAVELVVAEMATPIASAPAMTMEFKDTPDEILGWRLWELTTGTKWKGLNQGSTGSCVGFGTTKAIHMTMAAEVFAGEHEEVKELAPEITYAGSRVERNGGRSPFRGDGSIGAWAAEFVVKWGVLARGVYLDGKYDFSKYDARLCQRMGYSGVPDELESIMAENRIGEFIRVTNFEQAYILLAQGYGIQVASSQGFRMTRDKDGYLIPQGSWAHSMCFIGGRKKGRRGLFCDNSWGDESFRGPLPFDGAPPSGGMVDERTVNSMLGKGDSFAFATFNGFKRRRLSFS
jgi:hypothetical protein